MNTKDNFMIGNVIDFILTSEKKAGRFADYLRIARLDHSTKHIFIVPGIVFAYLLRGVHNGFPGTAIVLGLVAAVSIASATM